TPEPQNEQESKASTAETNAPTPSGRTHSTVRDSEDVPAPSTTPTEASPTPSTAADTESKAPRAEATASVTEATTAMTEKAGTTVGMRGIEEVTGEANKANTPTATSLSESRVSSATTAAERASTPSITEAPESSSVE